MSSENRKKYSLSAFGVLLLISLLTGITFAVPSFTRAPTMTPGGANTFLIDFAVSEAADVEVSVVNPVDSTVMCHLAAGLLGTNPPPPLVKDSLHQKLTWDGRDDLLRPVSNAASCLLRVRAGMSVSLDGMVGENDYKFYRTMQGLTLDSTGSLYVFGAFPWLAHHGTSGMTLRKYDRTGQYQKTLWPVPAGLSPASLSLYNVITLPGNQYFPRSEAMDAPQLGGTPLTYENSFLCPQTVGGKIMVCNYPDLNYILLRSDGTPTSTGSLVKSPAIQATGANTKFSGPIYLTQSPDQSYFLLSGCYQMDNGSLGWFPSDTGVWRDGQVYKVNAATGVATILLSVPRDSLPKTVALRRGRVGPTGGSLEYMAAIHGTAFDDSGHIFVCNRLFSEVGVYDLSGVRLGGLGVVNPDQVVVNRLTGAIYVLSRRLSYSFSNQYPPPNQSSIITLSKFSSWRVATGQTVPLGKTRSTAKVEAVMDMEKVPGATFGRMNLVIDCSGASAVLWLNGSGGVNAGADSSLTNIRGYRDDGNALTLIQDFRNFTRKTCTGFDRIAVDRKTERVYVNNSWNETYKIEDWAQPLLSRCSTSLGAALPATDIAVSPDGFLYVHENLYDGPVKRYTQAHLHAPANFGARGTNVAVTTTHLGYGAGTQDRGIAVTRDGKIYTLNGSYLSAALQQYDTSAVLVKDNVVGLGLVAGGIRTDLSGKLYISAAFRPPEQIIPSIFTGYWPVTYSTGAIVKFDPDSNGAFTNVTNSNLAGRSVQKALKVYKTPVSPFGGTCYATVTVPSASYGCVCRYPRFDVDPYGRILAPHTVIGRITVVDNAGNEILSFGEYGNADSRGPGSPVPGPVIPFAWPVGVASSEDFIYVTDLINARLVRVRMNYALDNLPDYTVHHPNSVNMANPQSPGMMRASPNPFNSRVAIILPGGISGNAARVTIYNASGKAVKTLTVPGTAKPTGVAIAWDGRNSAGRRLPSGVYFCCLENQGKRQVVRLTFLR